MSQQAISNPTTKLEPTGQLLGSSWKFFRTNIKKLVLISLILMGPTILNQILILIFGEKPNPIIGVIMTILGLLSIVTGVWGTIALITFIKEKNPEMEISEAFNQNASLFWSYLWVGIIIGVIVFIGLILLIIPGIILGIYYSFYSYILVCEKIKGYAAGKKSMALVKNYWWAVFGRILLLGLLLLAVFIVLILILWPLNNLNPAVYAMTLITFSLLFSPFSTVYFYNLYQNLGKIKNLTNE